MVIVADVNLQETWNWHSEYCCLELMVRFLIERKEIFFNPFSNPLLHFKYFIFLLHCLLLVTLFLYAPFKMKKMFTLIKFCQQKVCIQGVLEASFHLSPQQSCFSYIQVDIQPFRTTIMNTVIINIYVYIHIHNFCFTCKVTEWNFIFKQRR